MATKFAQTMESKVNNLINIMEKGPKPDDRWRAIGEIVKIGKPALPLLLSALRTRGSTARIGVSEALSQIYGKDFRTLLTGFLKHKQISIRKDAAFALGKIGGELAKKRMLGRSGYRMAVPALSGALKDKNPEVRAEAVKALAKMRDIRALPALRKAAKEDKDVVVRKNAEDAIKKLSSVTIARRKVA
jgi:HEAT repeat protein